MSDPPRPPRSILFVGLLLSPVVAGGMDIIVHDLLLRLVARGYHVRAIAPFAAGTDQHEAVAALHPGVDVTTYPVTPPVHNPRSEDRFEEHSANVARLLPGVIAERRPDVILVGHQAYVGGISRISQPFGVPVVVWVHSSLAPMTVGDGVLSEGHSQRILTELRRAALLIACGRHLLDATEVLGLPPFEVVPNGVDLNRFHPGLSSGTAGADLDVAEEDIVVLHPTNLKRVKRGVDLAHSARQALQSNPRLLYIATGDKPLRNDLEQACKTLGIEQRFRFPGWVTRDRAAEFLALADMVVMTSEAEGLALAYLEAQATATPLVSSDIPAAREVVRHGETGLLYPVGDIDMLAAHTLWLAASAKRRSVMGANGRRYAEGNHSIDAMVGRFERLIGQTIATGR